MKELINNIKKNRFSELTLYLIDLLNNDDNLEIFADDSINIVNDNKRYIFFALEGNNIIVYDWNIIHQLGDMESDYNIMVDIKQAIINSRYADYNII